MIVLKMPISNKVSIHLSEFGILGWKKNKEVMVQSKRTGVRVLDTAVHGDGY